MDIIPLPLLSTFEMQDGAVKLVIKENGLEPKNGMICSSKSGSN